MISKTLATVTLAVLLLHAPIAPAAEPQAEPLPFDMPTPEGWRTETIPFPLGFAPELDYEGLEELRFSPGMFDPESEEFWTYAFIWWVPAATRIDAGRIEKDLVAYFRGLATAVAAGKDLDVSAATFEAEFEEMAATEAGHRRLQGRVVTLDAFATHEPVELGVRVTLRSCGPDHQVAFFELSPQPRSHSLWKTLAGIRDGLSC